MTNSQDQTMFNETEQQWSEDARIYEYGSAANPDLKPVPVIVHPPELHQSGETRILPFDLSQHMNIPDGDATSPNLMASFIRIQEGESIATTANATSQAFYVIRGSGSTFSEHGTIRWGEGDMFVVPVTKGEMKHSCIQAQQFDGAALYWIHDQPLLDYLGVEPSGNKKFEPTLYKRQDMLEAVEEIRHDKKRSNNRLGVLLGNQKCAQTKTLTHVLWSLLNSIPGHSVQRPHRHNSVALDLCVSASPNVYTLMGREIDEKGFIIDPIRCDWAPGGVFVTPPGWWHSHHNESDDVAWVLPIQDAGLFTHQRTLDIRFVDDELALHHAGRIRGSAFTVSDDQFLKMKELSGHVDQQESYNAHLVTQSSFSLEEEEEEAVHPEQEEKQEAGALQVTLRRHLTVQVGSLASEGSVVKSQSGRHQRRKSIQVGADLPMLRKLSTLSIDSFRM